MITYMVQPNMKRYGPKQTHMNNIENITFRAYFEVV